MEKLLIWSFVAVVVDVLHQAADLVVGFVE